MFWDQFYYGAYTDILGNKSLVIVLIVMQEESTYVLCSQILADNEVKNHSFIQFTFTCFKKNTIWKL